MTIAATKLLTAEEFFALGDIGRSELIDGEVIRMSPSGASHGSVAATIAALLRSFVKRKKRGVVFGAETGFKIAPRRVRAPDVGFVASKRLGGGIPSTFFDGPPDLAVEVVSPSDTWPEVTEKVADWLARGAKSCWVVDPTTRTVVVYHAGGRLTKYDRDDTLRDADVLPGYSVRVSKLFEV